MFEFTLKMNSMSKLNHFHKQTIQLLYFKIQSQYKNLTQSLINLRCLSKISFSKFISNKFLHIRTHYQKQLDFLLNTSINQNIQWLCYNQILNLQSQPKSKKLMQMNSLFTLHNSAFSLYPQIRPIFDYDSDKNYDFFISLQKNIVMQAQEALLKVYNSSNSSQKQVEKEYTTSQDSENLSENHQMTASNSIGQKINIDNLKKRKNKEQTKQEIQDKQKDQGRGGNCIASNITKTLLRVIQYRLDSDTYQSFKQIIEKYKIKSQKQNTIIILFILFDFVKRELICFQSFEIICKQFFKSLDESKMNCEKKIEDQPVRKSFHQKNKKMYANFIAINRDIYDKLKQELIQKDSVQMSLQQIAELITDAYDRKQREIEKALNKIRSITSNHPSLKKLFGHQQNDIQETFFEAISYAYRRNLQKRCKRSKNKAKLLFEQMKKNMVINSDKDEYLMCYFALKLIGQKQTDIWMEFIKIINLKKQFNQSEQQRNRLTQLLTEQIPNQFVNLETVSKQNQQLSETESEQIKIEDLPQKLKSSYKIYVECKHNMEL